MSAPHIRLRSAQASDEPSLWLMLTYAASMDGGGPDQITHAQVHPYLCLYVESWGQREGDLGVVAVDDTARAVGAAWLRRMPHDSDLAVGSDAMPELATGVVPELRGRGIGRQMMNALIARATRHYEAVVLAVREDNRAASFYRSLGFREQRRIVNRVGGPSIVMKLRLHE